jgi:elongation factor G
VLPALLSIEVAPTTPADAERLARGLQHLAAEDAALHVRPVADCNHVIIAGTHERHLETILDRLSREFQVEAGVGPVRIAYKETVTRDADAHSRYIRQTGGRGHFAEVKIYLHPGERGSGCRFENHIVGGAIPKGFINAVRIGIDEMAARGLGNGYPMDDVRVDLYDGSYHETDSSEATFRMVAAAAFQQAALNAGPILLEPVMRMEIAVPAELKDGVLSDLLARRGQIQSQQERGDTHIIHARVPLPELFGYDAMLRDRTAGGGICVMEFDGYEPCHVANDDETSASLVRAPHGPTPKLRSASVELPEPED